MIVALLDEVKLSLRLNGTDFDEEVQGLIDAARKDLIRIGVIQEKVEAEDGQLDPLIKRAIITYCKAEFGYDNPEADRFKASYDMIRQELSSSSEYKAVPVDEAL